MNTTQQIPELLAPAGNLKTGLAALQNGADAVYAGLQRFNARERGANFTLQDMARLIEAAREQQKKIYVTFNTLLKEDELDDAACMLADVSQLQPDGVIVQDLAVIRMLRQYLPDIPIHASTQMGTHNSAGAQQLAALGVERVILERQLTLDEVKAITSQSPIETEVFIHGALCCSLSGMCLLSSWMGGWSGNRGKCKQPCRRRYHRAEGNGFFFSPKDLYTLDLITELCEAGVASLKIEGRLKPAQYVVDAVRAYRLMLDTPPEQRPDCLKEARRILSGALGRKWSHGFYTPESSRQVIQYDTLGSAGRLVGRVLGPAPDGVAVECLQTIRQGDRLRIQPPSGDEGPGLTVQQIKSINNRPLQRLTRGGKGIIACHGDMPKDGLIFKTGYSSPDQENSATQESTIPAPVLRVNLEIRMDPGGVQCRVSTPLFASNWKQSLEIPTAENRPLTSANLTAEFIKVPPPGIGIHHVSATIDGDLFLPFRKVRELRRQFWAWAQTEVLPWAGLAIENPLTERLRTECAAPVELARSAVGGAPETVVWTDETATLKADEIPARSIYAVDEPQQEAIIPDFCREHEMTILRQEIQRVYGLGCRRFRVTSLYGINLLEGYPDLEIAAAFPLPVSNSMALKELLGLGVRKAMGWVELDLPGLQHLAAKANGALEIMRHGWVPLLTTRATIPATGRIADARGGEFVVVKERNGLTRLYAVHPLEFPALPKVHELWDRRPIAFDTPELSSNFNLDREWQ